MYTIIPIHFIAHGMLHCKKKTCSTIIIDNNEGGVTNYQITAWMRQEFCVEIEFKLSRFFLFFCY